MTNKTAWNPTNEDTSGAFIDGSKLTIPGGGAVYMPTDTRNGNYQAAIDILSRQVGLGSLSDAYGKALRGINHRGLGNPIRTNRDNSGLVLFTRPDLNLTYDNIALNRMLTPLLTDQPYTLQRYIRAMLDFEGSRAGALPTPLVNHQNPFIPLLTNNLMSLSGWPDVQVETYSSKEGIVKESWGMIDGHYRVTGQFDLTANFRNIEGDPISAIISAWLIYATAVRRGDLNPYPRNLVENRMDYTTRVYHLVLDPSRRFVTKIAAIGYGFPTTVPHGAAHNYVGDQTYVQSTEQISVNFTCYGADYNDPISIDEFNSLVAMVCPQLDIVGFGNDGTIRVKGETTEDDGFTTGYIRLLPEELKAGVYYGIPLIHPISQELLWYVTAEEYNELTSTL